ncbi:MAG: hypothetical protein HY720_22585 [Planctomycetes bacterium]|nr:hypothetical protein [Planctomycetota bacterium]
MSRTRAFSVCLTFCLPFAVFAVAVPIVVAQGTGAGCSVDIKVISGRVTTVGPWDTDSARRAKDTPRGDTSARLDAQATVDVLHQGTSSLSFFSEIAIVIVFRQTNPDGSTTTATELFPVARRTLLGIGTRGTRSSTRVVLSHYDAELTLKSMTAEIESTLEDVEIQTNLDDAFEVLYTVNVLGTPTGVVVGPGDGDGDVDPHTCADGEELSCVLQIEGNHGSCPVVFPDTGG